jgi:2-polyprenyl-6-methoxyphenol hydroxylase-like FAD-dependent oxidoreductase
MIDPDHWGMIAERKTGLWRVTYGDIGGLEPEEYLKRRDWHFEAMFPGRPKPGEYKIEQTNQFKIHNRCVKTMRVGRVLLAADAAHLCNPFGGYGAMTGILDVGALTDCLIGYYDGRAGEEILDLYAKIRREKFPEFVDRRSIKNMKRLHGLDPERALEEDKFLQMLKDFEKVPEKMETFLLVCSTLDGWKIS